jgi:glucose-6-phosphate 1-dehydrogenase
MLAAAIFAAVPAGRTLALYHIGLTKATSGHNGVTMTVEEAVTYTQPDSTHWALSHTDGYMDEANNGHTLICDRNFIYVNDTVLVGSKQWAGVPFPIDNGDGLQPDYFDWSITMRSYPLEAYWETDDYSPDGVNCGYGAASLSTNLRRVAVGP